MGFVVGWMKCQDLLELFHFFLCFSTWPSNEPALCGTFSLGLMRQKHLASSRNPCCLGQRKQTHNSCSQLIHPSSQTSSLSLFFSNGLLCDFVLHSNAHYIQSNEKRQNSRKLQIEANYFTLCRTTFFTAILLPKLTVTLNKTTFYSLEVLKIKNKRAKISSCTLWTYLAFWKATCQHVVRQDKSPKPFKSWGLSGSTLWASENVKSGQIKKIIWGF